MNSRRLEDDDCKEGPELGSSSEDWPSSRFRGMIRKPRWKSDSFVRAVTYPFFFNRRRASAGGAAANTRGVVPATESPTYTSAPDGMLVSANRRSKW